MRELHLEKSIEVIAVPSIPDRQTVQYEQTDDLHIATLIECAYFSVKKWSLSGSARLKQKNHSFLSVLLKGRPDDLR